jgi:hypothetical protein
MAVATTPSRVFQKKVCENQRSVAMMTSRSRHNSFYPIVLGWSLAEWGPSNPAILRATH